MESQNSDGFERIRKQIGPETSGQVTVKFERESKREKVRERKNLTK
jgi:hypothetical protein